MKTGHRGMFPPTAAGKSPLKWMDHILSSKKSKTSRHFLLMPCIWNHRHADNNLWKQHDMCMVFHNGASRPNAIDMTRSVCLADEPYPRGEWHSFIGYTIPTNTIPRNTMNICYRRYMGLNKHPQEHMCSWRLSFQSTVNQFRNNTIALISMTQCLKMTDDCTLKIFINLYVKGLKIADNFNNCPWWVLSFIVPAVILSNKYLVLKYLQLQTSVESADHCGVWNLLVWAGELKTWKLWAFHFPPTALSAHQDIKSEPIFSPVFQAYGQNKMLC